MILTSLFPADISEIKQSAEKAAEEVLESCWKERQIPVDPFKIATTLGIIVKFIEARFDIAGGLLKDEDSPPVIFLNKDDPPNRLRFTCSHEIGHYFKNFNQRKMEYLDYRNKLSATGTEPEEVFANNFAGNLLMPKRETVKCHEKTLGKGIKGEQLFIELATQFAVSADAMKVRLRVLGLVT